mgnify:FL=1
MGSFTGTARVAAQKLRAMGKKVGVLKVRSFRPFPAHEVARVLANAKAFGVLDRNYSYGYEGALFTEIKASLYDCAVRPPGLNFIGGLGGRDIRLDEFEAMFTKLEQAAGEPGTVKAVNFIGLR